MLLVAVFCFHFFEIMIPTNIKYIWGVLKAAIIPFWPRQSGIPLALSISRHVRTVYDAFMRRDRHRTGPWHRTQAAPGNMQVPRWTSVDGAARFLDAAEWAEISSDSSLL